MTFQRLHVIIVKCEEINISDKIVQRNGCVCELQECESFPGRGGGGALPHMGYIGMCRREGYGFQAVYSSIGYINQSVCV